MNKLYRFYEGSGQRRIEVSFYIQREREREREPIHLSILTNSISVPLGWVCICIADKTTNTFRSQLEVILEYSHLKASDIALADRSVISAYALLTDSKA